MNLLSCENISKQFGGLSAVSNVSFCINEGELVGLIGPNGAGKTTFFNLITGFLPSSGGKFYYQGKDITGLPPHQIASLGLVRTFQKINICKELSVLDNVLIGFHLRINAGFVQSLLQTRKQRVEEKQAHDEAMRCLKFVGLSGWEGYEARNLPLGLQRALGIAIALVSRPKLLLLDEPASGMNPEEKNRIVDVIHKVFESGITVLLVEHDMNVVMTLCRRILVLESGSLITEGTPEQVQNDPMVIEIYLGRKFKNASGTH